MCLIITRTILPERLTHTERKKKKKEEDDGNQYGRTIMISNSRMFRSQVSSENTLTNVHCHIDIATLVLNGFVT